MKKFVIVLLILFCSLPGVFAEKVDGVEIPNTIRSGGETLQLNGAGTRMKFIIKVYVGGLYLQSSSTDPEAVIEANEPMAIRLEFVRNVDNQSIIDAWNAGFKNSAADGYRTSQNLIDQFNGVFSSNVKKDGVYLIEYIPDEGTRVSINGEERALIRGLGFKQAVFAIWLGSKPADQKLKEGMLSGR